ncbi:class I SAM-dependent methyltransferase [Maricaulis sp.]|uniref:class I SAM-dependent methyltransferase n=1 Tax=Maricaulis sp. TaxID=1486257 RepID=UPI003A9568A5
MRREALELDRFYRSRQGLVAREMIGRRLTAIWPDAKDLDLLGLGFATPYLEPYRSSARRSICFMPAAQGAVVATGACSGIALGDETHLPFPEALFDRVLLVHALEEADSLQATLREIWRVLAPEGRVVIVTAARSGIWAWLDSTPFGHGRPFSRAQLSQLLDDALFEPTAWSRALYTPPWKWSTQTRIARMWEETGERVWPALGGVILVEAVKRTMALRPRPSTAPARRKPLEAQTRPALSRHDNPSDLSDS